MRSFLRERERESRLSMSISNRPCMEMEDGKWYQHRPQTVQVNQWNQILLTTTFWYFLFLLPAICCPPCAWCEKDCCSWLAALHFAILNSLLVDAGWFILLPECWQTAKYSGVNFGYNYAEAQKPTIRSECNLGYTTVTQNAKLLILKRTFSSISATQSAISMLHFELAVHFPTHIVVLKL